VANSLNLICAQRLVRRVCEACKESHTVPRQRLVDAGAITMPETDPVKVVRGKGCERCAGTGYKGRVGLFEVMEMSEGLREQVLENASSSDLRRRAIAEGMLTLRQSGLKKVLDGFTTIEEVVRETM
jgi:type IV pilus assembly protein PilB